MYKSGKLAKNFYRSSWRLLSQRLCAKPQKTLAAEPFANGTNSNYVEEMYEAWQKDPRSVHAVRCFDLAVTILVLVL